VLGGEGEETRDHILDADVARLVVQVVKRRSHGVLNLASGTSHSFREVAEMVAACFKPPTIVKGSLRNAPVTHRRFDVKALHEAFPEFRFTPLDEAIRKTHAKAEQD
jgi:nucleoside-diphosphate-sugar epimerase